MATEAVVPVDSDQFAAWKVTLAGGHAGYFYRPHAGGGALTATPATHEGLIARVVDVYGNEHRYDYTVYGTNLASQFHAARLSTIQAWPNGATDPVAEVEFVWIDDDALPNAGRLAEAREHRWDDASPTPNKVEMNRVVYSYKADADGLPDDLGTEGDLMQVVAYTRLDTSTSDLDTWKQSVTQYRYHGGVENEDEDDDLDGFIERGSAHQLKMVFMPEQIEQFAKEYSGYDAMVDTAAKGGEKLLELGDGDLWYTGSTRKAVHAAAKIIAEYETTGEKRVVSQHIQAGGFSGGGGCGCGGAGGFGTKLAYEYFEYGSVGYGDVWATTKVETYTNSGAGWSTLEKTEYYDTTVLWSGGQHRLKHKALVADGKTWVSASEYDTTTGLRTLQISQSAIESYTPGTAIAAPAISYSETSGLVVAYRYLESGPWQTHIALAEGVQSTPEEYTVAYEYTRGDLVRPWLVTRIDRHRTGGATANEDIESIDFEYGFHTVDGNDLAWIKSSSEAELEIENGPSGTDIKYLSYTLFDEQGLVAWKRSGSGSLVEYEYDHRTGLPTVITQNSSGIGLGSEWGLDLNTTGWGLAGPQLDVSVVRDLIGRPVRTTFDSQSDLARTIHHGRFLSDPTMSGIALYTEIELPHVLMDGTTPTGKYAGPATVTWFDAGGGTVRVSSYEPEADMSGDYDLSDPTSNLTTELSRAITWRSLDGGVEREEVWWDIANGKSLETTFGYDSLGRKAWTRSPAGTYTRHTHDALDRVIQEEVGTVLSGGSENMVTTAEYFYDHGEVMGSPVQGVGDGRLTLVRRHASSTETRDTETVYDFRGRAVKTINALPPHEFVVYDNLGRAVERATFASVPTDIATPLADRGSYSKTHYSQRGLAYRTQVAIDPTAGSPSFVESHRWFDADGKTVASWGPNGPAQKFEHDSLGRVVKTWTTNRGGDAAPGASGNYADATALTGDIVLEQTQTRFIADTNLVDLTTRHLRAHDVSSGDTGDLLALSTPAGKVISTFSATYYDDAGRPIRSVNFGTNLSAFKGGGSAPTITQSSPPDHTTSPTTQIVWATAYNVRGQAETTTSPEGVVTRTLFDDLGRRIAVIEGYDDASVVWSEAVSPHRWVASDLDNDHDRVTSFVYDDGGHLRYRVAHLPDGAGEKVQITEYVRDTSAVSGSLLSSNEIVTRVKYPDRSTGAAGGSAAYWVDTTFNRLGEPLTTKDQAGTIHAYARDALGRVILDEVTAFGTHIDDTIDSIEFEYDDLGRRTRVRSYSSTTVKNAMEFEYTVRGEVAKVWQDHDSDIDKVGGGSNSLKVEYSYATADVSSGNFVRMDTLTYPDGAELEHRYGSSSSLDDIISRVSGLALDSVSVVEYDRIGLGMDARVRYPEPMVRLDRWVAHNGDRVKGEYPGYDRFGRVARQVWVDDALTTHLFNPSFPNRTPIVELAYAHDRMGNPVLRVDARPGAAAASRDEQYLYDAIKRLEEASRGSWGGSSLTVEAGSDRYSLDAIGNWDFSAVDKNGNTVFTDPGEKTERTNNMANEVTVLDIIQGAFDPLDVNEPPTTYIDVPLLVAWDDQGNMLTRDEHLGGGLIVEHGYTHDAWNRLVHVRVGAHDRAAYEYNGLGWRIRARSDDPLNPDGTYDEERVMYFDASWRMLEELIDDDLDVSAGFDRAGQQVWGLRYIDDAVLRRTNDDLTDDGSGVTYDGSFYYCTDVNFSPLAVLDEDAHLVNRVRYRPYGLARHQYPGDLDEDGEVTSGEVTAIAGAGTIAITSGSYDPNMDIDRNGTVSGTNDGALVSAKNALPEGWVSQTGTGTADSSLTRAGYIFNHEVGIAIVRHRSLLPEIGLWAERDPMGYMDGSGRAQYVSGNPITFQDPTGLIRIVAIARGQDFFGSQDSSVRGIVERLNQNLNGLLEFNLNCEWNHLDCVREFDEDADLDICLPGPCNADVWIKDMFIRGPNSCRHTVFLAGHSNGGDAMRKVDGQISRRWGISTEQLVIWDAVEKPLHFNIDSPRPVLGTPRNVTNYYQRESGWIGFVQMQGYRMSNADEYRVEFGVFGGTASHQLVPLGTSGMAGFQPINWTGGEPTLWSLVSSSPRTR